MIKLLSKVSLNLFHFYQRQYYNMKFSQLKTQIDEQVKQSDLNQNRTKQNIEYILEIVKSINNTLIFDDVLYLVIKSAIRITESERGFIVLRSPEGKLEFKLGLNSDNDILTKESFHLSSSVVEDVFLSGQSVFIEGALNNSSTDLSKSIINLELQTIMCSPLTVSDQKIGVIYVDSRYLHKVREKEITNIFEILAGQAASAIRNAQLYHTQSQLNLELQELNRQMLAAKEKAERADKLKTEFLAQISHEIRTPLNVIVSFATLLKEEVTGLISEDLLDGFSVINNEGKRIIRTIDLIVNMSELQVGAYEAILRPIELYSTILVKIVDEFKVLAREKGLELSLNNLAKEPLTITGDEYSIFQIFNNLVDNAIKYTPNGKIEINVYKNTEGNTEVEVKDTGIGISKEYLPNLFKPFSQEEQGYSRRYEGNGLGLALVEKYCEINNASITVESEKGHGTSFKVTFR